LWKDESLCDQKREQLSSVSYCAGQGKGQLEVWKQPARCGRGKQAFQLCGLSSSSFPRGGRDGDQTYYTFPAQPSGHSSEVPPPSVCSYRTSLHESLWLFTRIVLNFSSFVALHLMVVLCPDIQNTAHVNSFTFQMLALFFDRVLLSGSRGHLSWLS